MIRTMRFFGFTAVLTSLIAATVYAGPEELHDTGENVLLVMSDGVRWQEFFEQGADAAFPIFWSKYASQSAVYGAPNSSNRLTVANAYNVSLPAYESILTGQVLPECRDNVECGKLPVAVPTFLERLVQSGMKKEDVAVFASWDDIAQASEHVKGSVTVNAGLIPVNDLLHPEVASKLNDDQMTNRPKLWGEARSDSDTVEQAMHYLEFHRPRFMFISLNDSDEWGHRTAYDVNGFKNYKKVLRAFDASLDRLFQKLDSLGEYGKKTTVIVTTDHGRGNTPERFPNHGPDWPEANKIWAFIRGPHVDRALDLTGFSMRHTHIDISPTVEALMGLCIEQNKRGSRFREVFRTNQPPLAWMCPTAASHLSWFKVAR